MRGLGAGRDLNSDGKTLVSGWRGGRPGSTTDAANRRRPVRPEVELTTLPR